MPRYKRLLASLAGLGALSALLAGCGGGGSGSSLGSGSGSSRSAVNVYITDSFADNYTQVDVTVYSIALSTDGTNYTTVYSSTTGMTVDVSSLSTVASLIGSATIPTGTYKDAKVTVGDTITVVPRGGNTSNSFTIDLGTPGASSASNNETTLTFPFNATVSTNAQNQVVIDFNLANFEIVNGKIQPSLGQASTTSFMQKQRNVNVGGTVGSLASGGFTLTLPGGNTDPVTVSSSTSIYSSADGSTVTLANGNNVMIQGTLDPTTNTITATDIRVIEPITNIPDIATYGTVSNVTSSGFTLTIISAVGFNPTGASIAVTEGTSTAYHVPLSTSASSSSVTNGETAIVTGSFDITTQTLTARRVDLYPVAAQ